MSALLALLQVGGGGGNAAPRALLSCLGFFLAVTLLPIISYLILKARSYRSAKDKPDFTSLRSTGKTIVNDEADDDDQSGVVN